VIIVSSTCETWVTTWFSPKEHLSNCANDQNKKCHQTKNKKEKGQKFDVFLPVRFIGIK